MATAGIKSLLRKVKDQSYSPIEVKVREATSSEPWGASTTLMSEIARATHDYQDYPKLFAMTWKRLTDVQHVMHVQKALILVDYLLRNGSTRFTEDCKHRARDVAKLTRYKHYDANNEDDAKDGTFRLFCNCLCSAARAKAKAVYEMLTDDAKLAEERAKAEKIKDVKAQGMGNDSFGLSMRENGGGGNNLDRQMALEAAWDRPDRPDDEDAPAAATPAPAPAAAKSAEPEKAAAGTVAPVAAGEPKKKKKKKPVDGATPAAAAGGGGEIRRPSFESPVPAAAVPVAGGISFDDDPFGPPTNPGGGGAATAAYQARLKNDNFEEYVVNTAAATRPAGGIDFLTAGNAVPSAGALTDIFAEGIKASNPGGGAAGANEWTSLPSPNNKAGDKKQSAEKPKAAGGADVWDLVNIDNLSQTKPRTEQPKAGGPSMSEMRNQTPVTIFDDGLLGLSGGGPATPQRQQAGAGGFGASPFAGGNAFPPAGGASPFGPAFGAVPAANYGGYPGMAPGFAAAPAAGRGMPAFDPFAPVPAAQPRAAPAAAPAANGGGAFAGLGSWP